MRRAAAKHNSLALGLLAKQQEKSNSNEALNLLDKAISIYDDGRSRMAKAGIYHSLKQDDKALSELNHVIEHGDQNAPLYLQARQLKDEIENPPKKGMCFIATAAYGSVLAPEVVMLSRFRDDILLKSRPGMAFVRLYYIFSPHLAAIIRSSKGLRLLTRVIFLGPLLSGVKQVLNRE